MLRRVSNCCTQPADDLAHQDTHHRCSVSFSLHACFVMSKPQQPQSADIVVYSTHSIGYTGTGDTSLSLTLRTHVFAFPKFSPPTYAHFIIIPLDSISEYNIRKSNLLSSFVAVMTQDITVFRYAQQERVPVLSIHDGLILSLLIMNPALRLGPFISSPWSRHSFYYLPLM